MRGRLRGHGAGGTPRQGSFHLCFAIFFFDVRDASPFPLSLVAVDSVFCTFPDCCFASVRGGDLVLHAPLPVSGRSVLDFVPSLFFPVSSRIFPSSPLVPALVLVAIFVVASPCSARSDVNVSWVTCISRAILRASILLCRAATRVCPPRRPQHLSRLLSPWPVGRRRD